MDTLSGVDIPAKVKTLNSDCTYDCKICHINHAGCDLRIANVNDLGARVALTINKLEHTLIGLIVLHREDLLRIEFVKSGEALERRQHPRQTKSIPAAITYLDSTARLNCTIRNISAGGCMIQSGYTHKPGAKIMLSISGKTSSVQGTVRWTTGENTGIEIDRG